MTDITVFINLLEKNDIFYHCTALYDDNNNVHGYAVWLNIGHVEFDLKGTLTNIVNY